MLTPTKRDADSPSGGTTNTHDAARGGKSALRGLPYAQQVAALAPVQMKQAKPGEGEAVVHGYEEVESAVAVYAKEGIAQAFAPNLSSQALVEKARAKSDFLLFESTRLQGTDKERKLAQCTIAETLLVMYSEFDARLSDPKTLVEAIDAGWSGGLNHPLGGLIDACDPFRLKDVWQEYCAKPAPTKRKRPARKKKRKKKRKAASNKAPATPEGPTPDVVPATPELDEMMELMSWEPSEWYDRVIGGLLFAELAAKLAGFAAFGGVLGVVGMVIRWADNYYKTSENTQIDAKLKGFLWATRIYALGSSKGRGKQRYRVSAGAAWGAIEGTPGYNSQQGVVAGHSRVPGSFMTGISSAADMANGIFGAVEQAYWEAWKDIRQALPEAQWKPLYVQAVQHARQKTMNAAYQRVVEVMPAKFATSSQFTMI